jgi:hypothetical protein
MAKSKAEQEKYDAEKAAIAAEAEKEAAAEIKAVAPIGSKALGDPNAYDPEAWGQASITSKDVIIPRILLMQPMSPGVTEGKAKFGDFIESMNSEKLGDFENGIKVVPFYMEKVFIEYKITKKAGGKEEREFFRMVPITPVNENAPYEDEALDQESGEMVPISRDRTMNFYVLLVKELEIESAIPHIISFRKSSLNAGKKMTTQMYMKNINAGKNPASMIMSVLSKKQTGVIDGNNVTYGVCDVAPVGQTPPEYISEAFRWLQIIKEGKTKVDENSFNAEAGQEINVGPAPSEGTGKF